MPFSVFEVDCPICGGPMEVSADQARCLTCDRAYLMRMGHLIPLPQAPAARSAAQTRTGERIS